MTVNDRINGVNSGTAIKVPVRLATTGNITLSGLQSIDGATTVSGDRVMVKNQTDTTENGIYAANSSAWTRTKDFDGTNDVVTGTTVFVTSGNTQAETYWYVNTAGDPTPGDALEFTRAPLGGNFAAADDVSYDNSASGMAATDVQSALDELAENRILAKGTAIASATTTAIGTANSSFVSVTGTTTITSFGSTGDRDQVIVQFDGILTLTHNATSLILPGAADITTAAGDVGIFARVSGANWKCVAYHKADGTSVATNTSSGRLVERRIVTSSSSQSTPSGAVDAYVTVVGGGGGGGGASTGAANGSAGGTSSFGAYCQASGGSGGNLASGGSTGGRGGAGGVGSGGDINHTGDGGGFGMQSDGGSGKGGASLLGGGGHSIQQNSSSAGVSGGNYGGGGSGGTTAAEGGGGGGGGGAAQKYIAGVDAIVAVTIGAGGDGGAGTCAGGAGAQGVCIIDYYS